jgi:hypothetical protein
LPLSPLTWAQCAFPGLTLGRVGVVGYGALEESDELGPFGARRDQAHAALEDVDDLGQLVERRPAEEGPEACSPIDVLGAARRDVVCNESMRGGEFHQELGRGDDPFRSPFFVRSFSISNSSVPADTALAEEDWLPV